MKQLRLFNQPQNGKSKEDGLDGILAKPRQILDKLLTNGMFSGNTFEGKVNCRSRT